MKSHELDIANFLSCYNPKEVKKGIKLWALEHIVTKGRFKKELSEQGWYPIGTEKPKDREYYLIDGEYWVQDPEIHQKMVEEAAARQLEKRRRREQFEEELFRALSESRAGKKKTDLSDIQKTELKCPICNGTLYKQPICPGCKEGRKGFRIRLICDEDADHEFLL